MLKHALAGCLAGLLVALATWSFLPTATAQSETPKPETPKRGLSDKAYLGISWQKRPNDALEITQVYTATPAWDAGLIVGDCITAVEVLRDGKPAQDFAPPSFLLLGLTNAAPGTEFKVKIRRGEKSFAVEKAIFDDLPKLNCEIPAARSYIEHIQRAMKDWNGREHVWVTIKSCSFREFSEFHMREQQLELVRTQILELQVRMEKEEAEIKVAYQRINTLLAQEDLAKAQKNLAEVKTELARIQQMESGFSIAKTLLGLAFMIFGL